MEKITYSFYRYAPETMNVNVNGLKIDISNTNIAMDIISGNEEKAFADIKRLYRKMVKEENRFLYVFFVKGTKQFKYIECLNFTATATIQERLYNYKELKHYLQAHPETIQTESGSFNPYGNNVATEKKTEVIEIDYSKAKKIRIA